MKVFEIDLYDYFGVKAPEGGAGILSCYIAEPSVEINPDRKSPAMLVIPGGGYGMVSFREAEPIALSYLAKGFQSFVLTYSVAPIRYPYQLTEAIMAMNYIRLNADELHLDPKMVAAVGFSAGGHLCSTLGNYCDSPEAAAVFKSKVCARPDAIILSYAVLSYNCNTHQGTFDNLCGDDEQLKKRLSIENLVDKDSAPAFLWATYDDGCVPVINTLIGASAYCKAGIKFSVHVFGMGWHGASLADETVYGKEAFEAMEPVLTKSVREWVPLSIEWLREQGINIKD